MLQKIIEAISSNNLAQIEELLNYQGWNKIITAEDYSKLVKAFDIESINPEIIAAAAQAGIIVESEQNGIIIRKSTGIFSVEQNENSVTSFVLHPNSTITVIDNTTNDTIEIPTIVYLLAIKALGAAYSHILQQDFDASSLQEVSLGRAMKMLAQYQGDGDDQAFAMVSDMQEFFNNTPAIVKYINFASVATKSKISVLQQIAPGRFDSKDKYSLELFANIISSSYLTKIVNIIEDGGDLGALLETLDAISATPEMFVYLNLGPVLQSNPELATQMVQYIIGKGGHANGHIASMEGDNYVIKPILAHASDNGMQELVNMLVQQQDPMAIAAPVAVTAGGSVITEDAAMHHANNILYKEDIYTSSETPILMHLMRTNAEAAKHYIETKKSGLIMFEENFSNDGDTRLSALALSIELGIYTLEQAIDKHLEMGGSRILPGNVLAEIIKSAEDIRIIDAKLDFKTTTISIQVDEEDTTTNKPIIIHFIEQGRMDIVDEMIKVGADLSARSIAFNYQGIPMPSTGPSAFELALDHGYTAEQLLQNIEFLDGNIIVRLIKNGVDLDSLLPKITTYASVLSDVDGVTTYTPLAIYFIKEGDWYNIQKLIDGKKSSLFDREMKYDANGRPKSDDSVMKMLVDSGRYELEQLKDDLNITNTSLENIMDLYKINPAFTLDLIRTQKVQLSHENPISGTSISGNIVYHAVFAGEDELLDVILENIQPGGILDNLNSPITLFALKHGNKYAADKLVAHKDINLFAKDGSTGETIWVSLIKSGAYTREQLIEYIKLDTENPLQIMELYNIDRELALELVKSKTISMGYWCSIEGTTFVGNIFGHAIVKGADELLDVLLAKKLDLNYMPCITTSEGMKKTSATPLLAAIRHGSQHAVEKLCGYQGISWETTEYIMEGSTNTHTPGENVIEALEKSIDKFDFNGIVRAIASSGSITPIEILAFAKVNENTACAIVPLYRDLNVLSFASNNLASFDGALYTTLFSHAMELGYFKLVDTLLDRDDIDLKSSYNQDNHTILLQAISKGYWDLATKILNHATFTWGDRTYSGSPDRLVAELISAQDYGARDEFMRHLTAKFSNWASQRSVAPEVLDSADPEFIGRYFHDIMVEQTDAADVVSRIDAFTYCVRNEKWGFVNAIGSNDKLSLERTDIVWDMHYIAERDNTFGVLVRDNHKLASKILLFAATRHSGLDNAKTLLEIEDSPFPINAESAVGDTLGKRFKDNSPAKKWLFDNGYIPRDAELLDDVHDVHAVRMVDNQNHNNISNPLIAAATKFYVTKLLNIVGCNTEEFHYRAIKCPPLINALKAINHPYAKLLKLPHDTREDLFDALQKHDSVRYTQVLLNDSNTRDEIVNKVVAVLNRLYLALDGSNSELSLYSGYPTYVYSDFYDAVKDKGIMINIRDAIGAVKLCIDTYKPDKKELEELCKDAILHNPEKAEAVLGELPEGQDIYKILMSFSDEQLCIIFGKLTNLDCIDVVRQNKLSDFAIQLYMSATTYSYDSSACPHGTFVQVVQSLAKIMPKFIDQLAAYYTSIKNVITLHNLGDLPDIEAAALLGAFTKMNVEAEMHEVLEFFMGEHIVPKDITAEQQKLFAVINAAFSAEINNILPDLKRMPTGEEYQTLLSAIQSNMVLKNFMHEYHEAHKSEMVKFTDAQKQKMKEEKEKFAAQQRKVAEVEAEEAEATEAFVVNYDAIPPLESEVAGNSLEELDHL